jgi:hypothetical protein
MHDDVKNALRTGIVKAGALLQPLTTQFSEPHLFWQKEGAQWRGEWRECPSLMNVFRVAAENLDAASADLCDAIRSHHPRFAGMVGFPSFCRLSLLHDPSFILNQAMNALWKRHKTFQPPDQAVEAIIAEFSEFVDQPTIRFRFIATILNYQMDATAISFPDGLTIRRLTENEISEFHGGSLWERSLTSQSKSAALHEYAIEGEHEERIIFGDAEADATQGQIAVRGKLDKALLALRTFKGGRVGFESIRFESVDFCPIMAASWAFGDLYVPFGSYAVAEQESDALRDHAALIFACNEPAMEMACSRLADAQTRFRPRDQIIDAVVGLEALLLAGLRPEDRRGELRFRFSLHYSTLSASSEDRYRAFRLAKDLYDLRSAFAHGAAAKEGSLRVGDSRLPLSEAANLASDVLRDVVKHFLRLAPEVPYKEHEFWERAIFALPPDLGGLPPVSPS